jgi:hypothetical protein
MNETKIKIRLWILDYLAMVKCNEDYCFIDNYSYCLNLTLES